MARPRERDLQSREQRGLCRSPRSCDAHAIVSPRSLRQLGASLLPLLSLSCGGGEARPPATASKANPTPTAAPANDVNGVADAPLEGDDPACRTTKCRPARAVELAIDGDRTVKFNVPAAPYMQDDMIAVVHGDDIAVTGDRQGDKLVHLRLAKPGEQAIKIKFRQERMGGKRAMMLQIRNPFDKPLRYEAGMNVGREQIEPTSSCPVPAGIFAIETWPHPIVALYIRDLRFVPEGGDLSCK